MGEPGGSPRPIRHRLYADGVPARIYALANQKGGVGKTTTAVNLAACLAEAGEPALVVDLDPQANATSGLGERANGTSSYDLLDGAPLEELAKPTRFENLWLVPAKPELAGAVVELARRDDGERYLADSLAGAAAAGSDGRRRSGGGRARRGRCRRAAPRARGQARAGAAQARSTSSIATFQYASAPAERRS